MQTDINFENNKIIAKRFLDLVSEGNLNEIYKLIDDDWRMHIGLGVISIPAGHEGIKKLFESFGKIEQQWTIDDMIAEGDKVVVRATNTCRQDSFLGVPSYGVTQIFTATFVHRIVNNKIVETWRNADDLGRVLQLGAEIIPPAA
jgi:predicted SnoaL-like aldol condensation-catalyzing enzyme